MSLTDEASGASKPPPKGGIVVSAQKKRLRDRVEDGGLHLNRKPNEAVFQRAIPPSQPRTPFDSAFSGDASLSPAGAPIRPARHHRSRRGLLALLRSRRKGRQRVINFILLPLAVLAATAIVVWILKFL